jgi:hypothetical protein
VKAKKCKVCKVEFMPARPLQAVCGFFCALTKAREDRQKAEQKAGRVARVELRVAKEKAKTRGQWMKEAQAASNAWRRESEIHRGCISCGTHFGKMNGGHYRSVGSSPATRFEPLNCWPQCERCNSYLSGNLINYRVGLLKIIGSEKLEYLEGPHAPQKYTTDDLREIKKFYSSMVLGLKRNRGKICQ